MTVRTVLDPSREVHLAHLSSPLDILVIGGGITGAGIALDAATRGYRVGLIDQADFAGGTSSRSTKLIHGGIRYLAKGQIRLVREALQERTRLLRLAPYLVQPQPFLIPLYTDLHRPLGVPLPSLLRPLAPWGVRMGLWAYDRLAGDPGMHHRALSVQEVARQAPALVTRGLRAAYLYHDARTDDVRLTLAVLATARRFGATTVNYARAVALVRDGRRVSGLRIEDRLTGHTHEVRARHVVNASGIWAEQTAALDGLPPFHIRHSKGVHLVLRRLDLLSSEMAVVIPETDDGRLAFLVPWAGRMILGTTDDPYEGPLDAPAAVADEVTYLLDHANRYLQQALTRDDIVGIFAGIRSLIAGRDSRLSDLLREHAVVVSPSGLVSIIGGKLTSYRQMAEDTVDVIIQRDGLLHRSRTASLPLASTEGLDAARERLAGSDLTPEQRRHLLETYGGAAIQVLEIGNTRPDLLAPLVSDVPVIAAEVLYACRMEMAMTLVDWMFLRSRLSVLSEDGGRSGADRVVDLMAGELGWNTAERTRHRDAWEAAIDLARAAIRQARATVAHL